MKLQKNKRTVNNKTYYQYEITIPPRLVRLAKIEGKDLDWDIDNKGQLVLIEKRNRGPFYDF